MSDAYTQAMYLHAEVLLHFLRAGHEASYAIAQAAEIAEAHASFVDSLPARYPEPSRSVDRAYTQSVLSVRPQEVAASDYPTAGSVAPGAY